VGPSSVRIARADLLTPPEFDSLVSYEHPAGRIGGARIEFVREGRQTHLGASYQQIPVRLFPPFVFERESAALLYIINLTAGLMDGDGHRLDVTARAGTRAVLTGQSATRVHPARRTFASQQWSVKVEDDACLVVLPGPVIPFRACRYYQRGRAELAPHARLIWGDIWFPGRYERGALSERFLFERILQDFEVRRSGSLIYRERFCWDGPWNKAECDWFFGGALACGSLFISEPPPDPLPPPPPDLRRSVLPLDTGACCLRWCGDPASVTADLVRVSLQLAADWIDGPGSPPWLVASGSLAPNHWFMPRTD